MNALNGVWLEELERLTNFKETIRFYRYKISSQG